MFMLPKRARITKPAVFILKAQLRDPPDWKRDKPPSCQLLLGTDRPHDTVYLHVSPADLAKSSVLDRAPQPIS